MKKTILISLPIFAVILSSCFLVSCGGGGGTSLTKTEKINGIVIPPDPGEAGKKTLAGIDSNNNGIRDDVDRFIAKEFGKDKKDIILKLNEDAKLIGSLFEAPVSALHSKVIIDKELKRKEIDLVNEMYRCATDEELDNLGKIVLTQNNTKGRLELFNKLLGGEIVLPRSSSCEK